MTTVEMFLSGLMIMGGIGFIFGVAYPTVALLCFPLYRRYIDNTISLKEYMRGL